MKLTNNYGYNAVDLEQFACLAQTFSHWTFEVSKGQIMVTDLQGICSTSQRGSQYWLLSDPQLLSQKYDMEFGRGDIGINGIHAFFESHVCSKHCSHLGLARNSLVQLTAPTIEVPIPASKNVLAGCWGMNALVLESMRKESGCPNLVLPRRVDEGDSEWVWARIYGSLEKARAARRVLLRRIKPLVATYGDEVTIPSGHAASDWSDRIWKDNLLAWQSQSGGAIIVRVRPKADASKPVVKLLFFPPECHVRGPRVTAEGIEAKERAKSAAKLELDSAVLRSKDVCCQQSVKLQEKDSEKFSSDEKASWDEALAHLPPELRRNLREILLSPSLTPGTG